MNIRRITLGLIFIFLGIAFFIKEQKYYEINFSIILVISTIICGYFIIKSLLVKKFYKVFLPAVILFAIYNNEYSFIKISFWTIITAGIFINIGLGLLFYKKSLSETLWNSFDYSREFNYDFNGEGNTVFFGESTRYIDIENIDNLNFNCAFGESSIYFNRTNLTHKTINVNVGLKFGEMNIYIPSEWKLENNITNVFGEVNVVKNYIPEGNVEVNLSGYCSFGEVNIIFI